MDVTGSGWCVAADTGINDNIFWVPLRESLLWRSIRELECIVNICLFSNFLFKIAFLTIKHKNDLHFLLFHTATLKFQALVTVCYQWIYAFSIELWMLKTEPLWDSFLNFCASWASVTTTVLLQLGENIKSHFVPQPNMAWQKEALLQQFGWEWLEFQPYSPALGPSHFHLSALLGCILVVTDSKMLQQCKKL